MAGVLDREIHRKNGGVGLDETEGGARERERGVQSPFVHFNLPFSMRPTPLIGSHKSFKSTFNHLVKYNHIHVHLLSSVLS